MLLKSYIAIGFAYGVFAIGFYLYYLFDNVELYILGVVALPLVNLASDPCRLVTMYRFQTEQIKKQEAQLSTNNEK